MAKKKKYMTGETNIKELLNGEIFDEEEYAARTEQEQTGDI
jgi:hypothetical protein